MKTVAQKNESVQIEELEHAVQTLLTQTANDLARETKFVQRASPLTGAIFAQALIWGWLACPDASYTQLQQMVALRGCEVSAQALEQRMTERAADFLLSLLHALLAEAMRGERVQNEVIGRFTGVYLQDGTIISLPASLSGVYQGCGGKTEESGKSALRVQIRLNMQTGELQGPWVQEGRACERKSGGSVEALPLPEGSLFVADAAYFTFHSMRKLSEQHVGWLTHARADLAVVDAHGIKRALTDYLKRRMEQKVIDEWVTIGGTTPTRQKVRLIAFRVSEETARRRREQAGKRTKARGKGSRRDVRVGKKHARPRKDGHHRCHPSKKRLELSEWTILLTNVAEERLSAEEARALMRCRWQIELVWRLWKERGQIDIWRSEKEMRILCEIYAKLLGMVLQHWLLIVGCWQEPHRSLVKASLAVKLLAPSYALTLDGPVCLHDVILAGKRAMARSTLNTSRKRPSTADLLEQPALTAGLG